MLLVWLWDVDNEDEDYMCASVLHSHTQVGPNSRAEVPNVFSLVRDPAQLNKKNRIWI